VLRPIESVSIDAQVVWRDNRVRAYASLDGNHINGFLLFDVTSIPPGSTISSMHLQCSLEPMFGSPYSDPLVNVYYSPDDNWTRATATPGSLSLGALLAGPTAISTWIPSYDFVLDVGAHDWHSDLLDGRITIGFRNSKIPTVEESYIYFYGADPDPLRPPPQLTISYDGPTATRRPTWGSVKALFR